MTNNKVNILDRESTLEKIRQLTPASLPVFGDMTPRHMVEHLAFSIRFSNGKEPQQPGYPPEKLQRIKEIVIGTDQELPIGFRSPVLPAVGLPPLRYPDLAAAVENLETELAGFDSYFARNPSEKPVNPTMGELNYDEWVKFHNKHFTHHFRQFNLL